jgi:hypothetical protein
MRFVIFFTWFRVVFSQKLGAREYCLCTHGLWGLRAVYHQSAVVPARLQRYFLGVFVLGLLYVGLVRFKSPSLKDFAAMGLLLGLAFAPV